MKNKLLILAFVALIGCQKKLTFKVVNIRNTDSVTLAINGKTQPLGYSIEVPLRNNTQVCSSDTCRYEIKENGIVIFNADTKNYKFKNKQQITN